MLFIWCCIFKDWKIDGLYIILIIEYLDGGGKVWCNCVWCYIVGGDIISCFLCWNWCVWLEVGINVNCCGWFGGVV